MPSFRDLHYTLRIEPDLEHFFFKGELLLEMAVDTPTREVMLNALDLDIRDITLEDEIGEVSVRWETDADREALSLELGRAAGGLLRLAVRYDGIINDRMAGFYRSGVRTEDGQRWIAITQFQESDARRAFPCFDHPAAKGVFDIEMVVDVGLTAVSNGAILEEAIQADRKKRVRFETTPVMSTYLVFLGVGDFETTTDREDPRVRLVAPPGRIRYGDMGLAFGRKSLAFCEGYFGIPYPLSKLDLLAVPDFAFGAMENWGAVTFRENLLLDDPAVTSKAGRARICEVIAHEITHQWFGNLATPADWSYLWLNESFATYFGYGIVDHYHPDWGTWDQFLYGQVQTAMDRDALLETFPMELPGGDHVVINASTAPLIYSKGAGILRQIHGYIGEDRFRDGLNRYLSDHAYGNADSGHFWAAFDAVSGMPVSDIMKRWVEQKGFPLLTVSREGRRLRIAQERFTYLPQSEAVFWPVPVTLRRFDADGGETVERFLLTEQETLVDIGDAAAWLLNDDQTGFYRVRYVDGANLKALGNLVENGRLSERSRWGVQEDLFALVLAGRAALPDYLAFTRYFEGETSFLPAAGIARNLYRLFRVAAPQRRSEIRSMGKAFCEKVLDAIGYEPLTEEPHTVASLRDQVIWHAVQYGSQRVLDFAADRFATLTRGGTVSPDILHGILQSGAWIGGVEAFGWLRSRLEATDSEHERLALLQALGSSGDVAVLRESFDYVLDHVPDRNRFVPLAAMAQNPNGAGVVWEAFTAAESKGRFGDFHPLLYERVLAAVITGCGLEFPEAVKRFFEAHLSEKTIAGDVIRLSLERLEILLRLRATLQDRNKVRNRKG